ncbi:hypothetical protein PTKIN_Ptkin04bG0239900 [Pterospermum kingtungense]
MFQKVLTPSDAGKNNRVIIPKKYALEYFPTVFGSRKRKGVNGARNANDVELIFYDKYMKLWKFRYCGWGGGQIFVFTGAWNIFLKENGLRANDIISFYVCERMKENGVQRFWMIDSNKSRNDGLVEAANLQAAREVDLQLRLGHCHGFGEKQVKKEEPEDAKPSGFKLFGFHIC